MDTVFLIFNDHEVFVGDYYKEVIKKIPFKEQDGWECYDSSDFKELLEYMDYPLNYKRFKNNEVIVFYQTPKEYDMICQELSHFSAANSLKVGHFGTLLEAYRQDQEIAADHLVFSYEQKLYERHQNTWQRSLNVEKEDVEGCVIQNVTTEELMALVLAHKEYTAVLTETRLVLSPVNLYCEDLPKATRCLETYFSITKDVVLPQHVQNGQVIVNFTKHVRQLFGRTKTEMCAIKAGQDGYFYPLVEEGGQYYCKKEQLLGVITKNPMTSTEVLDWVRDLGF